VSKCFEVGYLLKCYYSLHSVAEYKLGLQYAVSFEGYRSNLESLAEQINQKTIHFGAFNSDKTVFKNQHYPTHTDSVLNTMDLKKNLIITGPNASGKTTQLKTTAINIIFTQQFGLGFYKSASLTPYTHIHSYLNIPDTSGRDSLFQAEARRCKEIVDIIDSEKESRHFCIFDELFSGPNADEATSASFGFLKYLQKRENVDFILTTHFVKLCKMVKKASNLQIQNLKMDATIDGTKIVFHYRLVKGISKIKAAKLILVQMGFPNEISNPIIPL
jgi:DNA mismatch repair ATPase MutS